MFTRAAMRRLLPYFRDNKALDWSMDRIWSNLGLPMMIFDTITMTHTKPCGPMATADAARWGGKTGAQWMDELQRQYPNLPPLSESRDLHAWVEGPGEDEVLHTRGILHRVTLALRPASASEPTTPPLPCQWCGVMAGELRSDATGTLMCRQCLVVIACTAMGANVRVG
jgi:hypothetical protein